MADETPLIPESEPDAPLPAPEPTPDMARPWLPGDPHPGSGPVNC